MSGIIEKVLVTEGTTVQAGQVIAHLDSSGLDHQISSVGFQLAILREESQIALNAVAAGSAAKLADRRIIALKIESLQCDLLHAQAQRKQLEVRSLFAGRVVTRRPEWLVGRCAASGEPLIHLEPIEGSDDHVASIVLP